MTYKISDFKGDAEFPIRCTGDVVVGDHIRFQRATFTGSFRNAKFAGFELITAVVVDDSYGARAQQHTFTLEVEGGEKIKIKGRNLYKNGVWRKLWENESERGRAADEKHERGSLARAERARLQEMGL